MMNKWIAAAAAGVAACLGRSEYEKKHLSTVYYEIKSAKLGKQWDGFRAVFLSDLHDNSFGRDNKDLLKAIDLVSPDVVLIGGDMPVIKKWRSFEFSQLESLLRELSQKYPVYYALGNHEQRMKEEKEQYPGWWEYYMDMLGRCRIHRLINRSVLLTRGGESIRISGITLNKKYYYKGKPRPLRPEYVERRLGKAREDCFEILLAHSPLFLEAYAQWGADLVLSGHFHGGTIRIPGLGGVMTPQLQFFSPLSRGEVRLGSTAMIVSAGMGTHSINIRLNNLPQLVAVTLKCDHCP